MRSQDRAMHNTALRGKMMNIKIQKSNLSAT